MTLDASPALLQGARLSSFSGIPEDTTPFVILDDAKFVVILDDAKHFAIPDVTKYFVIPGNDPESSRKQSAWDWIPVFTGMTPRVVGQLSPNYQLLG
jgi:hypothetical protein